MASERATSLICQHLGQLWQSGPGLTLETVEQWTAQNGGRVSRQAICRALNQRVRRMRDGTARQLAQFIESHTQGVISSAYLLGGSGPAGTADAEGPRPGRRAAHGAPNEVAADAAPSPPPPSWLVAVRAHQEALGQAQRAPQTDPALLGHLLERCGDAFVLGGGEHAIGRGYYQRALDYAVIPRARALLLCRLALVEQLSTHQPGAWLSAAESQAGGDPEVLAWVTGIRAIAALDQDDDHARAAALAGRALAEPSLDAGLHRHLTRVLLASLGAQRRIVELDQHASRLLGASARTPALVTHRRLLAQAYLAAGRLHTALSHVQAALDVMPAAHDTTAAAQLHDLAAAASLHMGDAAGVRHHALRQLALAPGQPLEPLCRLAKSWALDHHPACVDHALQLVEESVQLLAAPAPHDAPEPPLQPPHREVVWRACRWLGPAERVLTHYGRVAEMHRRLTAAAQQLSGIPETVWYFATPARLEPVRASVAPDDWTWHPGAPSSTFHMEGDRIALWSTPRRTCGRGDPPRMLRAVGPRFRLAARVHGGGSVLAATLHCRRAARAGTIGSDGLGGGGLLLALAEGTTVHLSAHLQEPGDVLCEVRHQGHRRILGRGFVGDAPVWLRLERDGAQVRAWVATRPDSWYVAGDTRVEPGAMAAAGLFAAVTADLRWITERAETVFTDVALETAP